MNFKKSVSALFIIALQVFFTQYVWSDPMEYADAAYLQAVDRYRTAYKTSKTSRNASNFARSLDILYKAGTIGRGAADGPLLVKEACLYLDEAARANPKDIADLLSAKGELYLAAGDKTGAEKNLKQSLEKKASAATLQQLTSLYGEQGRNADVISICKKIRPKIKDDKERYIMLDQCLKNSHAETVEKGLAWAPPGDMKFYIKEQAKLQKASAAYQATNARNAEKQRHMMSESSKRNQPSKGSSENESRSGSRNVSVYVRNGCSKDVRIFIGDKPKFGSGTYSKLSSNSVGSHTLQVGGKVWIVDSSDNGIRDVTISESTREIEVNSACNGFK